MDSAQKTFELQAQVRRNAEEFKNTLNDLFNWQKEIKDKEQELSRTPPAELKEKNNVPLRSNVLGLNRANQLHEKPGAKPQKTATTTKEPAKRDTTDGGDQKADVANTVDKTHVEANEMKDRGNKHVKLGEYEKAIHEYTSAIGLYPTDPIFYSNRALCYLKLEKYDECIEDCDRAIDIDSLAVKAYYRRMQANESLGNNMDALKDCTTVLTIEPKNSEAKRSLERINERLRKYAKFADGPSFSPLRSNMVEILPIEKPAYKRSNKPLRRVPVTDVVGPKDTKNQENASLQISDEDIDKLFNSNCGPFVEVKRKTPKEGKVLSTKEEPARTVTTNAKATKTAEATKTKQQTETNVANTAAKTLNAPESIVVTNKTEKEQEVKEKEEKKVKKEQEKLSKVKEEDNLAKGGAAISSTEGTNYEAHAKRPLPPPPTSVAQFYTNWKDLSPAQKYYYLKSIEVNHVNKLLGASLDSDTLSDLLHILHDFYLPNQETRTATTLLEISKNNQIKILAMFLSTDDQNALKKILSWMRERKEGLTAEMIAKNFDV